jgi:hypothetical protein
MFDEWVMIVAKEMEKEKKKVLDEKKWVEKSGKLKRFELMFSLPGS